MIELLTAAEVAGLLGATLDGSLSSPKPRRSPGVHAIVGTDRARLWHRADIEPRDATADRSRGRRAKSRQLTS
jgi:hypothetical protein